MTSLRHYLQEIWRARRARNGLKAAIRAGGPNHALVRRAAIDYCRVNLMDPHLRLPLAPHVRRFVPHARNRDEDAASSIEQWQLVAYQFAEVVGVDPAWQNDRLSGAQRANDAVVPSSSHAQ